MPMRLPSAAGAVEPGRRGIAGRMPMENLSDAGRRAIVSQRSGLRILSYLAAHRLSSQLPITTMMRACFKHKRGSHAEKRMSINKNSGHCGDALNNGTNALR